jgi:hypothetical protein
MARRTAATDSQASHYEVRCPTCNVSFPVGTRRCVHCGSPTALPGMGPSPSLRRNPLLELPFESSQDFEPEPVENEPLEEEGSLRQRSPFRLGTTSIWIVLALVGSLYRVCTGGG